MFLQMAGRYLSGGYDGVGGPFGVEAAAVQQVIDAHGEEVFTFVKTQDRGSGQKK